MSRLSLAIGLALTLAISGCTKNKYTGPYNICLESHDETYTSITTYDGGSTYVPTTSTSSVCDKYTKEQYIKVNKTVYEVREIWKEN